MYTCKHNEVSFGEDLFEISGCAQIWDFFPQQLLALILLQAEILKTAQQQTTPVTQKITVSHRGCSIEFGIAVLFRFLIPFVLVPQKY